jgi:hypothetical protein
VINRKRSWSEEDIESLRRHIEGGGSIGRAAVRFRRSEPAVRHQAKLLGLKFLTIRQRRAKAMGSPALGAEADALR